MVDKKTIQEIKCLLHLKAEVSTLNKLNRHCIRISHRKTHILLTYKILAIHEYNFFNIHKVTLHITRFLPKINRKIYDCVQINNIDFNYYGIGR